MEQARQQEIKKLEQRQQEATQKAQQQTKKTFPIIKAKKKEAEEMKKSGKDKPMKLNPKTGMFFGDEKDLKEGMCPKCSKQPCVCPKNEGLQESINRILKAKRIKLNGKRIK